MRNKSSLWPSPRLLLALVVSLLIHAILLSGVNLDLPDILSEHDRIDVVLAPQPKPVEKPPAAPPPAKPKALQPARPKPAAKPIPKLPVEPKPQAIAEPLPSTSLPEPPQPAAPPPVGVSSAPPPTAPVAETVPVPEVEESLAGRGYKRVDIEYRLFRGKGGVKGGSLGIAKHEYRTAADGSYSITATAEASGLVSLFVRGQFVQQSEGMIGPRGLVPSKFSYQRGDNPAKGQKASFDWQARVLTMESGQQHETAPLTEGAQDQLSFIYQFMFVPPLEQMQLAITNGKRFRTYLYQFDGEETLQTNLGEIRAFHISKHDSDGDGKFELWLAPDYRYLPVKISQTEKDGTVTEQLIKQLKAE